jgi:hypothetical protein
MRPSKHPPARRDRITQLPDALGAEGIAYHLDLPGAQLHLTGPGYGARQTVPSCSSRWCVIMAVGHPRLVGVAPWRSSSGTFFLASH